MWDAFQEQYGKQTAGGQLLAYFCLICILAVLAMVLAGQVLVDAAPPAYASAAGLIPFTALGFVMPALYRTVNQNVAIPKKRPFFIGGVVAAAVIFIGVTWALVGSIGVYAAPVGMIVGFGIPAIILFVRGQRGKKPLYFPYREVGTALLAAVVIGAIGEALPEINHWIELGIAAVLCIVWMALLIPLHAIPPAHWTPLIHMVRSFRSGTPADFRPRRGLRSLEPEIRDELRKAVVGRLPRERLHPGESDESLRLVTALRQVGKRGGIPVGKSTEHDADMGPYLFEDASTAVRNASMRRLLEQGAEANDLRALDDLVNTLARVPVEAWEDQPVKRRGHRGRRRRVAKQLRERASES
jgi:hypothetical protein